MSVLCYVTGCAAYKAVGTFERYNEVFVGDVNHNLLTGGGKFTLQGKISGVKCTGTAIVTRTGLTCRGQGGEILAECDDGRTLMGQWFAMSCTTGFGRGQDSIGASFAFTFGEYPLKPGHFVSSIT